MSKTIHNHNDISADAEDTQATNPQPSSSSAPKPSPPGDAPATVVVEVEPSTGLNPKIHELEELEGVVRESARQLIAAGYALRTIRETKLYKECGFKTWEAYCLERGGFSKTTANRLIATANLRDEMAPSGAISLPEYESHARALLELKEPEARQETWSALLEEHGESGITAGKIKEAVKLRKLMKAAEEEPEPAANGAVVEATDDDVDGTPEVDPKAEAVARKESAVDHADTGEEAVTKPVGDAGPESENAEGDPGSDGTEYVAPEWVDGILERSSVEEGMASIAKHFRRSPDAASLCNRLLLDLASTTNVALAGLDDDKASRDIVLVCQTLLKIVA